MPCDLPDTLKSKVLAHIQSAQYGFPYLMKRPLFKTGLFIGPVKSHIYRAGVHPVTVLVRDERLSIETLHKKTIKNHPHWLFTFFVNIVKYKQKEGWLCLVKI